MIWREYIEHISASQILDYIRNPRRWALAKLAKLPTCESSATQIGGMVHKAIEEYLTGMPGTTEHALADHCLRALIDNVEFTEFLESGKYDVERRIDYVYDLELPQILGYIDVILWDFHRGCPLLVDHKTSKTKRFFKSAYELKTDTQLVIYGMWALQQRPSAKGVFVQHNQFAYSNKRDVLTTKRTFICKRRLEKEWAKILRVIRRMVNTVEEYHTKGITAISRDQCKDCNGRFGPNSCEFNCICEGRFNEDGYTATYNRIKEQTGEVTIWDMRDATSSIVGMFQDLTKEDVVSNEIQINAPHGPTIVMDEDDGNLYVGPYGRIFVLTKYTLYAIVEDTLVLCASLPIDGPEIFVTILGSEVDHGDVYGYVIKISTSAGRIIYEYPLLKINTDFLMSAEKLRLTNKSDDDIIKVESEGTKMNIAELMQKAREQVGDKGSIFDRREAWTKAIVAHVVGSGVTKVLVPSHFASGSIDPDYSQLITQLKERGISVVAEVVL